MFVYLNSDKQQQTNFLNNKNEANQQQLNGSINSTNSNGSSNNNTTNLNNNNSNAHYGVGTLGGHNTILNSSTSLMSSSSNMNSRQKKYRTLNRIKGLFLATSAMGKSENDIYDLPPQQLKNELLKKINQIQLDLEKQHKER